MYLFSESICLTIVVCFSVTVIKYHDHKQVGAGKVSIWITHLHLSASSSKARAGAQSRKLEAGTEVEITEKHFTGLFSMASFVCFLNAIQEHLTKDGNIHPQGSGPYQIENATHTWSKSNQINVICQLGFLLCR